MKFSLKFCFILLLSFLLIGNSLFGSLVFATSFENESVSIEEIHERTNISTRHNDSVDISINQKSIKEQKEFEVNEKEDFEISVLEMKKLRKRKHLNLQKKPNIFKQFNQMSQFMIIALGS